MLPDKKVVIFGLGGTIASIPGLAPGVSPQLAAYDIVRAVPELEKRAEIECIPFRTVPGAHLRVEDLVGLAVEIERCHRSGSHGVVVMQGTDTIEETAFALDLLVGTSGGVVITGAMRNPTVAGADGPANILAAVTVAASPQFRDVGAVVVLNDSVHAAAWVCKSHTTAPSAFVSPMTGPIGWISEGEAKLAWVPRQRHKIPLGDMRDEIADVGLLSTWLGDDGRLVRAATHLGYAGLVIAGLGGGHVSIEVADALGEAAVQLPIILASRTGAGDVLRQTYGFVGSEMDLIGRGLLPAGPLDGVKARLLLALCLTRSNRDVAAALRDFRSFTAR